MIEFGGVDNRQFSSEMLEDIGLVQKSRVIGTHGFLGNFDNESK